MKKATILLLSFAALISFTQCNNSTPEQLCSNAASRGKIISSLMNNDGYMKEVMDSMRTKHGDAMLSTVLVNAKNDQAMQMDMMNSMMSMCKSDTAMCKMMMDKTMEMCDMDQSKCNMMMGSMQSHPNVMKSIQGMCDMKGMKSMKMEPKK